MKKRYIVIFSVLLFILIFEISGYFLYKLSTQEEETTITYTEEELLENQGIIIVSQTNFVSNANLLLSKGYSANEINQIYTYMSETNIEKILNAPYTDLTFFYHITNFDFDKIERYLAYQSSKGIEMSDAVTQVNLNLDTDFYSNIETIEDPTSLTVLVNKYNALPSDYEPDDLVSIPSFPNLKVKDDIVEDLENLLAASVLDGLSLIPYSAYRSYSYQTGLYNTYLSRDGNQSLVDTYSARPGHSEHQTGLAIDIRSSTKSSSLTDSDYEWMLNNSYKYGFIVRYQKGSSYITGYQEEPWHIRYVGIAIATEIYNLGITFDEYYDLYLTNY